MEQPTITCTNCNAQNPVKNLFCQTCGKPLMVGTATVVSSPAPIPEPPAPPPVQPPPFVPPAPAQGLPPQSAQPGFYPPPPPPPPPPPVYIGVPAINSLGVRLESWTEVYAGMANKEKELEDAFIAEMQSRPLPQTRLAPLEFSSGMMKRLFHVIQSPAGTVATHIAQQGKDLSVSWTLYARQKPNWKWIGILIGIVFGISFFTSLIWITDFGRFLLQFLFGSFSWVLVTIAGALAAGKVLRGDLWAFFIDGPDDFEEENLEVMAIVVQQAIESALEKTGIDQCSCGCCKES